MPILPQFIGTISSYNVHFLTRLLVQPIQYRLYLLIWLQLFYIATAVAQSNMVESVAVSPDGKVGFSFNPSEKKIIKWNTEYCWPIASINEDYNYTKLSVSNNQTLAVSRLKDIQLYNEKMEPLRSFPGKGFISRSGNSVVTFLDKAMRIYETASGTLKNELTLDPDIYFSKSSQKSFSETAMRIAVAGNDFVQVTDVVTGKIIYSKSKLKSLTSIALDRSGQYLAMAYDKEKVLVVEVNTQKEFSNFTILNNEMIFDIAFNTDPMVLFVLTGSAAEFWRISDPKKPKNFSSARVSRDIKYIDQKTGQVIGGESTTLFSTRGFDVTDEGWFAFRGSSSHPAPYFFIPPRNYVVPPDYLQLIGSPVKWNIEKTDIAVVSQLDQLGNVSKSILIKNNGTILESNVEGSVSTFIYAANLSMEDVFIKYKINGQLNLRSYKKGLLAALPYDAIDYQPKFRIISVQKNGKFGLVNPSFKEIIECRYDYIESSTTAFAPVKKNEKWGYVNESGQEIVPCRFEDISYGSPWENPEWLVPVKYQGKWGYIDRTGKEIVPFEYDKAEPFISRSSGIKASVEKNGKSLYIDLQGNIIKQ